MDADLLRETLDALKNPSLNTPALQARIAARLASLYAGGGSASSGSAPGSQADTAERRGDEPLDAIIPILPGA